MVERGPDLGGSFQAGQGNGQGTPCCPFHTVSIWAPAHQVLPWGQLPRPERGQGWGAPAGGFQQTEPGWEGVSRGQVAQSSESGVMWGLTPALGTPSRSRGGGRIPGTGLCGHRGW